MWLLFELRASSFLFLPQKWGLKSLAWETSFVSQFLYCFLGFLVQLLRVQLPDCSYNDRMLFPCGSNLLYTQTEKPVTSNFSTITFIWPLIFFIARRMSLVSSFAVILRAFFFHLYEIHSNFLLASNITKI